MTNSTYLLLGILVIGAVTAALRILPFLIFSRGSGTPAWVSYLGRVLPYAVMTMLLVYCLKGVSLAARPYGLPELIACMLTVLIHLWKKNTLFSILCGTLVYMFLVQVVFV